ncbi:MAG: cytochrome c, partial [Chloroflexi bacterium]
TSLGCAGCHAMAGGGVGPSLQGLYGATEKLADGATVVADENYLRESILNPNAKIVAGYAAVMPSYQGQISEDQLNQLIAYIKSLADTGN